MEIGTMGNTLLQDHHVETEGAVRLVAELTEMDA
jgi:hypothetical protein